jgi:hypothetical protein
MLSLALLPSMKFKKTMTTNVPMVSKGVATLDASGNGTLKLGPIGAREVWHPDNIHVNVSTHVNEAQCQIYVGDSPIQSNFRDGTFSGSSGDATDKISADVVKVGQYVWAVWTGGDAAATATATVTGTKDV